MDGTGFAAEPRKWGQGQVAALSAQGHLERGLAQAACHMAAGHRDAAHASLEEAIYLALRALRGAYSE